MRLFVRYLPLLLAAVALVACDTSARISATPDLNEAEDVAPDAGPVDDLAALDEQTPDPELGAGFQAFSMAPESGPVLWLGITPNQGGDQVTVFVRSRQLGDVAGLAFYLEYDADLMAFEGFENHLSLGDQGPYFTQSAAAEIKPGNVSYGAARFCKDKIPWGTVDQCGAQNLDEEAVVATFTFKLLHRGVGVVRFPADRLLVRRADRSPVQPTCVGGTVAIGEVAP